MTEYILEQITTQYEKDRVAVIKAGSVEDAIWTAEQKFGGDWIQHSPNGTLDELKNSVEDAEQQAIIVDL